MDRPAWLRTKPALFLARVLMCFLYWQRHRMTARRRGWRWAKGSQGGANRRFWAQAGQRCPFNLARGRAESLIKPRAMKTEQTAETTLFCLSHSHLTISFFFPSFLFIFWPESNRKNVTQGLRWHSWAEVRREKGGGGGGWGEMRRDVSHSGPGHVGPDRMGTGAVSWGLGCGRGQVQDCGFEGILAWPASVKQQIVLLEPYC